MAFHEIEHDLKLVRTRDRLLPRVPYALEHGNWHDRIPPLIPIGQAGDWTPAAPCQELARAAIASYEPVTAIVYSGAFHHFDHPSLAVHLNVHLAYTAGGEGAAHSGTNPTARADAM